MSGGKNGIGDRLGYLITLGFTRFAGKAPRKAAFMAGSVVGWLLWTFLTIQKKRLKITIENLRNLYPDKADEELSHIVRRVCRHFGRFLSDCARLPLLDKEMVGKLVKFEGFENLEKAFGKGKGVIFATAHFGHFEVANGAFAALGYPVWSVIREVDNKAVDILFDETRCATGLGVIKKERSAGEILRHLRAGHIVTINIDQNAAFNNIFAPFFGKLAATFTTPAVIGMRTGAPILPVLSFRDDANDRYTVRVYPEVTIESVGDRGADIRLVTTKLNRILEDAIREAPEQWLWIHRRWKTEPGEEDMRSVRKETDIIERAAKSGKGVGAARH